MKKLLIAAAMLVASTGIFAQAQPQPKKEASKLSAVKKEEKKEEKAKVVPMTKAAAPAPTKKDGTPDMRYKANKEAAKPGPTKKDGTPDMRYKSNKKEAEKKKS